MVTMKNFANILNNCGFRVFNVNARGSFPGSIKKHMDFFEANQCKTFLKKDKENNNYLLLLQEPINGSFEFIQFDRYGKPMAIPELNTRLTPDQVIAYVTSGSKRKLPTPEIKIPSSSPVKETNKNKKLTETLNQLKTEDEIAQTVRSSTDNISTGIPLTPEIISRHNRLIDEIYPQMRSGIPISSAQKENLLVLLKTENPQIAELKNIKTLDDITNDLFGQLCVNYSFKSSILNNERAGKINELLGILYRNNNSAVTGKIS